MEIKIFCHQDCYKIVHYDGKNDFSRYVKIALIEPFWVGKYPRDVMGDDTMAHNISKCKGCKFSFRLMAGFKCSGEHRSKFHFTAI